MNGFHETKMNILMYAPNVKVLIGINQGKNNKLLLSLIKRKKEGFWTKIYSPSICLNIGNEYKNR